MFLRLSLITLTSLFAVVIGLPTHNVTIAVPEGYSNHGNSRLFCVKTQWYHIVSFFAVNYVAHAATVRSRPGQKFIHSIRDVILALLFPSSGLLRALSVLWEFPRPSDHGLLKAFHAEALWVVEYRRVTEYEGTTVEDFLRADRVLSNIQPIGNSNKISKVELGFWKK